MRRTMEARLTAVQRRLLWLLCSAFVVGVVCRPQPDNRKLRAALDELTAFRDSFGAHQTEQALRREAEAKAALPLGALADLLTRGTAVHEGVLSGRGKPCTRVEPCASTWILGAGASPVLPLSRVALPHLADVAARAEAGSALNVALPELLPLAAALSWRLARAPRNGPITLLGVELVTADVSEADVALEAEVADLRLRSVDARAALDSARRKEAAAAHRVEKRAKRRSRSRSLDKAEAVLAEAQSSLETNTRTHAQVQLQYDEAAERAQRSHLPTSIASLPTAALARVSLEAGHDRFSFSIPVRLVPRDVQVTPLRGADFSRTREAGLWENVQGLDADGAREFVRSRFPWQMQSFPIGRFRVGYALVLQLLPCLLPALLALLLARMRGVERSYSPFSTEVPSSLPRVGFRHRALDLLALVVLPILASAMAITSLSLIGQPPILPAFAALLCLLLGGRAFTTLHDLRYLTVSIVRSHSYPPPAGAD